MTKSSTFLCLSLLFLFTSCEKESEELTLSSVKITKIIVNEYPITNGGVPWDDPFIGSATGPDITWKISGPQLLESTTYFGDASGNAIEFSSDFPAYISVPESVYSIQLFDIDDLDSSDLASNDDLMVEIPWKPSSTSSGAGTEWINVTGVNTSIDIQVTYLYE